MSLTFSYRQGLQKKANVTGSSMGSRDKFDITLKRKTIWNEKREGVL